MSSADVILCNSTVSAKENPCYAFALSKNDHNNDYTYIFCHKFNVTFKKTHHKSTFFVEWVDSSKRRNDAENLTLLNKSFNVIK